MKSAITRRKAKHRALAASAFLHSAIIVLGLLPVFHFSPKELPDVEVPVYFEISTAGSADGRLAPVESTPSKLKVEKPATAAANGGPRSTDIESAVQDDVQEPKPSDDLAEEGKQAATTNISEEVPRQVSSADSDTGDGQDSMPSGDGVITRPVIYRSNIGNAAFESGLVVVDICINRRGKVLNVANNDSLSTIRNLSMIREILHLVTEYRFEKDYSAALRECGQLTFIFDIETEGEELQEELLAVAAR